MTDSRGALEGARWASPQLDWLPRDIREPRSYLRSVAVGWLLAFPLSIALAALIQLMVPAAQQPQFNVSGPVAIFALVVFSPVVETLIMGGVLAILLRVMPARWAVVASSLGWGVAHSLAAPTWGLIIWWPFLIFSSLYVSWRQRSLGLALLVPMTVHALQNLGPALVIASGASV